MLADFIGPLFLCTPYWEAGVRESISHKAGLAGGDLPIELRRHPGCPAPVGWSILARRLGHPAPLIVTGTIGEKRSLQAVALIDAPLTVGHRDGQYCFWQARP
jgi:hypothetical protein